MESPVRDQSATCPQSSHTFSGTETERSLLTVAMNTGSLPGPQSDHATLEPSGEITAAHLSAESRATAASRPVAVSRIHTLRLGRRPMRKARRAPLASIDALA